METNNNEDPFRVRLNFTAVDYIRMSILAVTLLPIRLIGERESGVEKMFFFSAHISKTLFFSVTFGGDPPPLTE